MDEPKNQTINEEAGLPDNWVPLDGAPIVPGRPLAEFQASEGTRRYATASLPPGYQHDASFVDAGVKSAQGLGLMPLGIAGNPTTNAAIQSTAVKAASSTPTIAKQTIELQVPNIFTPTDQTVTLPGPLVLGLAPENLGTVFAAPPLVDGSLFVNDSAVVSPFANTNSIGFTLPQRSWVLLLQDMYDFYNTSGISAPAGTNSWSPMPGLSIGGTGGVECRAYTIAEAGTVLLTGASASWAPTQATYAQISSTMVSFSVAAGVTPAATLFKSGTTGSNSITLSAGTPTAGQPLIAWTVNNAIGSDIVAHPYNVTVSDTAGNVWKRLTVISNTQTHSPITYGQYSGVAQAVFICENPQNVSTSVTAATNSSQVLGEFYVFSVSGLSDSQGIPYFRNLTETDIPSVDLADDQFAGGIGGVYGNLDITHLNSGTNANSGTFWRGDGTWASPPAAGGGYAPFTANHTVGSGDFGKLLSFNGSNLTLTLPNTGLGASFYIDVENFNATPLLLSPTGTIDGNASLQVSQNCGLTLFTDGTNWFTQRGMGFPSNVNVLTNNYVSTYADTGWLLVMNAATAKSITLPSSAPAVTYHLSVENIGAGALTINPNGLNLDGSASSLVLTTGQGVQIFTDGSNYFTMRGAQPAGITTLAGLSDVSISSPTNNQVLTYNSGASKWENAASGGGGSVASGTPIIPGQRWTTFDSNFANTSITGRMYGSQLTALPTNWKVILGCVGGTGISVHKAVVYRTAPNSTTIVDVTNITFSSSSSYASAFSGATVSAPFLVTSDSISVTLDYSHDYYISWYLDSDVTGYNAALHLPKTYATPAGLFSSGYNTGDKTGISVGSAAPTFFDADGSFWAVVAA